MGIDAHGVDCFLLVCFPLTSKFILPCSLEWMDNIEVPPVSAHIVLQSFTALVRTCQKQRASPFTWLQDFDGLKRRGYSMSLVGAFKD